MINCISNYMELLSLVKETVSFVLLCADAGDGGTDPRKDDERLCEPVGSVS